MLLFSEFNIIYLKRPTHYSVLLFGLKFNSVRVHVLYRQGLKGEEILVVFLDLPFFHCCQ